MKLQLEFDESALTRIEDLKRETGLTTYKSLFDNALAILSWATQQRMKGRTVVSLDRRNQEFKELEMAALEHAARFAGQKSVA